MFPFKCGRQNGLIIRVFLEWIELMRVGLYFRQLMIEK